METKSKLIKIMGFLTACASCYIIGAYVLAPKLVSMEPHIELSTINTINPETHYSDYAKLAPNTTPEVEHAITNSIEVKNTINTISIKAKELEVKTKLVGMEAANVIEQRRIETNIETTRHLVNSAKRGGFKSYKTPLTEPSEFDAEVFDLLLHDTNLSGLGKAIKQAEEEFQVNGVFIVSVAIHESGFGTSKLAKNKNNLFGINAIDSDPYNNATTFESKEDCILYFGEMMRRKYFDNWKRTNLKSINERYASDPKWADNVAGLMNRNYTIMLKIQENIKQHNE